MKKNFRKISLVAGFVTLVCFGANAQWTGTTTLSANSDVKILGSGTSTTFLSIGNMNVNNVPSLGGINLFRADNVDGQNFISGIGFNLTNNGSATNGWQVGTDGGNNGGAGIIGDIWGNLHFVNVSKSASNNDKSQFFSSSNIANYRSMLISPNGNVQIGGNTFGNGPFAWNVPSDVKLAVNGKIYAKGIRVTETPNGSWPDYVFKKDYKLAPLSEVETFIAANSHLPNVPSEAEVKENGINMAEMDAVLLRKIEELTLYMIQLKKENEELSKKVEALSDKE